MLVSGSIISICSLLGSKEGFFPPAHITVSQMSKKPWYKVKNGVSLV